MLIEFINDHRFLGVDIVVSDEMKRGIPGGKRNV